MSVQETSVTNSKGSLSFKYYVFFVCRVSTKRSIRFLKKRMVLEKNIARHICVVSFNLTSARHFCVARMIFLKGN